MKKIIIDIDEEGDTTYKTVGFKGKMCHVFADKWKKALKVFGVEHEDESFTPTDEMNAVEGVVQRDRIQTGD